MEADRKWNLQLSFHRSVRGITFIKKKREIREYHRKGLCCELQSGILFHRRGIGAAGSAPPWHGGGQGFESLMLQILFPEALKSEFPGTFLYFSFLRCSRRKHFSNLRSVREVEKMRGQLCGCPFFLEKISEHPFL